jgi:hypothetical protein
MMDLSLHPLRVLPIPTGPTIEFRALPFPLPDVHRDVLKGLPRDEIDLYIASLRRVIGVDFSRPEYTHVDGLRALQRNGLDAS